MLHSLITDYPAIALAISAILVSAPLLIVERATVVSRNLRTFRGPKPKPRHDDFADFSARQD